VREKSEKLAKRLRIEDLIHRRGHFCPFDGFLFCSKMEENVSFSLNFACIGSKLSDNINSHYTKNPYKF